MNDSKYNTKEHESAQIPGSIITFGNREWMVLDVYENWSLVMATESIGCMQYHYPEIKIYDNKDNIKVRDELSEGNVSWATCSLREYLNETFFNSFSEFDRKRIQPTKTLNADDLGIGAYGGEVTIDRIFILSAEEVHKYFGDGNPYRKKDERELAAERISMDLGLEGDYNGRSIRRKIEDIHSHKYVAYNDENEPSAWWLRTPVPESDSRNTFKNSEALVVMENGLIGLRPYSNSENAVWVRPALWLKFHNKGMPKQNDILDFAGYKWCVLEVKKGMALLLSRNVLIPKCYHDTGNMQKITWKDCTLRHILNVEFYESFNDIEKARIGQNVIVSDRPKHTTPYEGTLDKIFLLSADDVNYYFDHKEKDFLEYYKKHKEHAPLIEALFSSGLRAKLRDDGSRVWISAPRWWLRSPSYSAEYITNACLKESYYKMLSSKPRGLRLWGRKILRGILLFLMHILMFLLKPVFLLDSLVKHSSRQKRSAADKEHIIIDYSESLNDRYDYGPDYKDLKQSYIEYRDDSYNATREVVPALWLNTVAKGENNT